MDEPTCWTPLVTDLGSFVQGRVAAGEPQRRNLCDTVYVTANPQSNGTATAGTSLSTR
jgi:hypothetical protein